MNRRRKMTQTDYKIKLGENMDWKYEYDESNIKTGLTVEDIDRFLLFINRTYIIPLHLLLLPLI